MEFWNDVMRCSRPASILLLAVVLLAACGMAAAGEIPEGLHQQQQQRVTQQQQRVAQRVAQQQERAPVQQQKRAPAQQQERAPVQQQKPAAQQQKRGVKKQQHAFVSAPQLLLTSGGWSAAAPAAANLDGSDAEVTAAAAEVRRLIREKQQCCSSPTKKKQHEARQRRKERRLLQPSAGATRGGVLLDYSSSGAGAAAVPAADPSCRAAAPPTAACQAEYVAVAATQPLSAASHQIPVPLQRQRSCSSKRHRSSRCLRHSSRRSTWGNRNSSSWGVCEGHGGTGRNEKNNSSSRRGSSNNRSSSSSGRRSARGDCVRSHNTKWNRPARCSSGGNDSSTKTREGTSGSSNSSRNAAEPRVWPAADTPPHASAAAGGASPFIVAAAGQSKAAVAAWGAAAAKVLVFSVVRGVMQPQSSTAAVAVSLAAAVATYPAAAAATPSPAAASSSPLSSGSPCSASSSFVSSSPSSSSFSSASSSSASSSSSSSKSASSASQRHMATSAKRRAPGVHAPETAAADTKGVSLSQQKQHSQQREQQQTQSDSSSSRSRSSFQGGQQQGRVQPVGQKQQQLEKKKNQLLQRSDEHGTTHGRLSLRPSAHLADISLRHEQQQQQAEHLKDEDWSRRVRISSRSLYAPEKSLLHMAAAGAAGPPRPWQAEGREEGEGRKEGEAAGTPKEGTAAAAAAAAGEYAAAGDHGGRSAADPEAAAAAAAGLAKAEGPPGNSSTARGSERKAPAHQEQQRSRQQEEQQRSRQQEEQQRSGQQEAQQRSGQREAGGASGQRWSEEAETETPQEEEVAAERGGAELLQQDQWREGVDNKRFPCVTRGKTTEGSVIREVGDVRTEHKCQRLCRRESSCTHAVLNTGSNACQLKTGVIDPKEGAAEDVLIPYNCADCWQLNAGINGKPFLNRKLYSPFGCLSYCLAQPRCTWWQYNVYSEDCQLFAEASEADVQGDRPSLVAGKNAWCPLTEAEQQELEAPEEGEAHLGSGWIRSQCMQPPHTKSLGSPFEQFAGVASADLCQKECQKRPLCRYIDFDRSSAVCRLFEKGGYNVAAAHNFVAGPRTCNMSCFLSGRRLLFLGSAAAEGLWEVTAATTMDCQVMCSEDVRCRRFSYCTDTAQCLLSSKGPSRRAQAPRGRALAEGAEVEQKEEEEEQEDADAAGDFGSTEDAPEQQQQEEQEEELSFDTREAAGCYVGPAAFCTSRGY